MADQALQEGDPLPSRRAGPWLHGLQTRLERTTTSTTPPSGTASGLTQHGHFGTDRASGRPATRRGRLGGVFHHPLESDTEVTGTPVRNPLRLLHSDRGRLLRQALRRRRGRNDGACERLLRQRDAQTIAFKTVAPRAWRGLFATDRDGHTILQVPEGAQDRLHGRERRLSKIVADSDSGYEHGSTSEVPTIRGSTYQWWTRNPPVRLVKSPHRSQPPQRVQGL